MKRNEPIREKLFSWFLKINLRRVKIFPGVNPQMIGWSNTEIGTKITENIYNKPCTSTRMKSNICTTFCIATLHRSTFFCFFTYFLTFLDHWEHDPTNSCTQILHQVFTSLQNFLLFDTHQEHTVPLGTWPIGSLSRDYPIVSFVKPIQEVRKYLTKSWRKVTKEMFPVIVHRPKLFFGILTGNFKINWENWIQEVLPPFFFSLFSFL